MDKNVEELLTRGVVEVIDKKHLEEKLDSGKQLRVKLGIDPTSPNIHIGRAVQLWKLRAFQDLGHTAVFIVGDFTGIVGDSSDKESERPMLTEEQIKTNMRDYLNQAFKILDSKKTETHYNSEWLSKLGYLEISKMASLFSLHEFESREVIARRLKTGQRISAQEMFYPLMQGYDSVAIRADVELGGTDQRYNLLAGRRIQPLYNQEPQDIMMMDILEGTDGRKMSSSWGNVINITDKPDDMFGKIMSVKDELVTKYFELCTQVQMGEIAETMKIHPKEAKMRLAFEITKLYHSEGDAKQAQENFEETFSKGGIPKEIETVKVNKDTPLVEVLLKQGLVSSKTEFNRLNKEGAIKEIENGVYRIGKHRFLRIKVI
ncbi:MAG: tyrosine--tRNA ligase [Candidatus Zambryskibacteria bacterium RIFCSPHIGHO2_02_FULL_43_14]|uniref:Tyrosine--tRNA ligase n=1 Tax=Candidatus Zambryskibacteria bacterium RIFCSPHIGHO2_02_FULL_43_14 TaxID=1802748 RepID=A0A1G2TII5_9BACT|nr:MAG: tyrosine--tRNA ligase [Candidatus Zambryskibacteria bacterium RIFCSPHIGHO2_01_FULL_43_60]OHA97012.1 MAG: tyrosine--tRNA ligase [Candidatus Zambryskibacteria bacterium RIFCSPHIGHO2_02_FULL_43_14]OHB03737.1 MAG: tyrosine--tRNA ligase [Candidatus Zambryskibacteria bacterium RIFCSPLOWO2_01_FULL_42_41]